MNVSLTPDLERFVREKVESGLYNSASEVVREALRLLVARDDEEATYRVAEEAAAPYAARAEDPSLQAAAARFRQALELLHLSYALMEQSVRRAHPAASEAEVDARLTAWKNDADWGEETPGYLERSPERLARLRRGAH